MPKAKPDQVIIHRIELQEREREVLESLGMAYTINQILSPVLSMSASGLIIFLSIMKTMHLNRVFKKEGVEGVAKEFSWLEWTLPGVQMRAGEEIVDLFIKELERARERQTG